MLFEFEKLSISASHQNEGDMNLLVKLQKVQKICRERPSAPRETVVVYSPFLLIISTARRPTENNSCFRR